ncbi:type II toxin-antitoxin system VapC family toxin [Limnospira fusiformis]|uniref:type II toxin-antitoxin system VapC family toxin n=1 Tax=Limnospira fusiformis TaxID=54297 RepID=UPI001449DAC9|nr:PIN domain-containing protein [Limnospira fusiformis SAG 85.79]
MRRGIIIDTGPLVALLNKRDSWHEWVKQEVAQVKPPLLTCESVISEACFLLKNLHNGQESVIYLLNNGTIQISFRLNEEAASIQELSRRYQSMLMSLADACIVRMAELYPQSMVLTLDSDFTIYRKNRNQEIPLIMPPS